MTACSTRARHCCSGTALFGPIEVEAGLQMSCAQRGNPSQLKLAVQSTQTPRQPEAPPRSTWAACPPRLCALVASGVVRERGLLLGLHRSDALYEIFVVDLRRLAAERQHARLNAHGLELRAVEVVRAPAELLEVHLAVHVHLARVDLHDARAPLLRGQRELNLSVDAPRAEQRRVEDVDPVGRRDHFDQLAAREAVHLVE
mmetsp:Transcript_4816/g.9962  ORF Transcript_4816/g.9962 Transcript_4816/m.9962 type:complete len:201 (-) Transcript_4816:1065-1667(-)